MIQKKPEAMAATKAKIQMQMKTYLHAKWGRRCKQVEEGRYDESRAVYEFRFDFGENLDFFAIEDLKLLVCKPLQEPNQWCYFSGSCLLVPSYP